MKSVTWRSPSNIALVKYWGKHGTQLPNNASISFTLENCHTETSLQIEERQSKGKDIELKFYFDKKDNLAFRIKILKFFESVAKDFPFLSEYGLTIHSENSFPHSSGIASSASSMSALALCLCDMQQGLDGKKAKKGDTAFLETASYYARLASGSAARSVFPIASVWGEVDFIKKSSDKYAIPVEDSIHKTFRTFQDSILIASSEEKKVSSRIGHSLMKTNPYAKVRYKQANQNLKELVTALADGDLETFGTIVEMEAMTLHALMMCSSPSFMLMAPSTMQMIEKIKQFRADTKLPVYFTLDAGPNVHLLYPKNTFAKVQTFIEEELKPHCEAGTVINDFAGKGPKKVK